MEKLFEKKDLLYICSPLSAPTQDGIRENMKKATFYKWIMKKKFECRTIAPHGFLPRYLDDNIPQERQIALEFGLSVLKVCKALIVCGDTISSGMAGEIRKARELGIKVYRLRIEGEKAVLTKMEALEDEMQVCKDNIPE